MWLAGFKVFIAPELVNTWHRDWPEFFRQSVPVEPFDIITSFSQGKGKKVIMLDFYISGQVSQQAEYSIYSSRYK